MLESKPHEAADTLLTDLQMAFEQAQLMGVWNWRVYFVFPLMLLRMLCAYVAHHGRVVFEWSAAAPDMHSSITRV